MPWQPMHMATAFFTPWPSSGFCCANALAAANASAAERTALMAKRVIRIVVSARILTEHSFLLKAAFMHTPDRGVHETDFPGGRGRHAGTRVPCRGRGSV